MIATFADTLGEYVRIRDALIGDFAINPWRTGRALLSGRRIFVAQGFRVIGLDRIEVISGRLLLGTHSYGFGGKDLPGLVRVRGQLSTNGWVSIGSGCRFDVGPEAKVAIGNGSYFGPETKVILSSGLTVGERCGIAWDCQFLDDDFHTLTPGKPVTAPITLGNDVWVGSRVTVLKGSRIGDGCAVASGAVVAGDFSEPNTLIAGMPARVIRRGIQLTEHALV